MEKREGETRNIIAKKLLFQYLAGKEVKSVWKVLEEDGFLEEFPDLKIIIFVIGELTLEKLMFYAPEGKEIMKKEMGERDASEGKIP